MSRAGEARPLELAVAALARRDYSAEELRAQLERRGVAADEAAEAVERLAAAGYVDDVRYAAARAETLAARGYGNAAIERELERHGVGREHVDSAISGLEPEAVRAERALAELGRGPRSVRRLLAKGFEIDAVEAAGGDMWSHGDAHGHP